MEAFLNWISNGNQAPSLASIDRHPILSKAQIKFENEMIMNADEPEELKPLINRWLVDYQNLTRSELAKFNPATQEALRAKYILARKMTEILKVRAVRRKQGKPNTKLNMKLADFPERQERPETRHSKNSNNQQNEERRELKAYVEKAFSVISNVEKRNTLLQDIFYSNNVSNDADTSTSASTGDSHTMHIKPSTNSSSTLTPLRRSSRRSTTLRIDNPQKRVLREVSGEVNTNQRGISKPIRRTGLPTIANGDTYIVIGPNGTKVSTKKFKAISFATLGIATRSLLCLVFPEEILAKNTLSGKPSPAFVGRERPPKGQLNPEKIADLEYCVMSRIHSSKHEVRCIITTKCSEIAKKYRRLNKTSRLTYRNEKLRDMKQEQEKNSTVARLSQIR
ncbi:early boundary activity protein 1 isoform X1 [Bactrocera oleae]|uniref:early boundary activity protein 1 isoform X1 n=1 Tax=Bactrocera oleae TaxID=104688 RepID=UPI00387E2624